MYNMCNLYLILLIIFHLSSDAFDLNYGVGILRVPDGFDTQRFEDDHLDQEESDVEIESSDEGVLLSHQTPHLSIVYTPTYP